MTARQRKWGCPYQRGPCSFRIFQQSLIIEGILWYWFGVGWQQCGKEGACWEAVILQLHPHCLGLQVPSCIAHKQVWTKTSQISQQEKKPKLPRFSYMLQRASTGIISNWQISNLAPCKDLEMAHLSVAYGMDLWGGSLLLHFSRSLISRGGCAEQWAHVVLQMRFCSGDVSIAACHV